MQQCYLCAQGELERAPGERRWGGRLSRPDRLSCPVCGAQVEQRGDQLRFVFIPAPYAAVVEKQLAGFVSASWATTVGATARRFLAERAALERGDPWEPPLRLADDEHCLYASEQDSLFLEQRTRANQPYWARVRAGPLVVTDRALYVGRESLPLECFGVLELNGEELVFTRHDRPQLQRIVFPDAQTTHLARLVLARLFPRHLSPPTLDEKPVRRRPTGFRLTLKATGKEAGE